MRTIREPDGKSRMGAISSLHVAPTPPESSVASMTLHEKWKAASADPKYIRTTSESIRYIYFADGSHIAENRDMATDTVYAYTQYDNGGNLMHREWAVDARNT